MSTLHPSLSEAWASLLQENPRLRIRDAASLLGVSEAALLETGYQDEVTPLSEAWHALLLGLKEADDLMLIVRNDGAVLEKMGPITELHWDENAASFSSEAYQVYFDPSNFYRAYAVLMKRSKRVLRSFQIFDQEGEAVLKFYLRKPEQEALFLELVTKLKKDEPSPTTFAPLGDKPKNSKESALGPFSPAALLKEEAPHRYDALLALPEGQRQFLKPTVLESLFNTASEKALPLTICVKNKGALLIHDGLIQNIQRLHGFLNVLDGEALDLHVKEDDIHEALLYEADEGPSFLEFYNKKKELLVQFSASSDEGAKALWPSLLVDLRKAST